jgi:hypothetical protein
LTAETNAEGCALFRSIEVGDYVVRLNRPFYVDKKGEQLSELDTTVSPNLVNVVTMPYDKAVSMSVSIKTLKPGTAFSTTATTYPSKAGAVSDNAAETSVLRTFTPNPAAMVSSITAPTLFPFDTAYSYFTGRCAYQSPVKTTNPDYFSDINQAAAVVGDPDAFQPQPDTVYQPSFNIRIRSNYANRSAPPADFDASALEVYATLQPIGSDPCVDIKNLRLATRDWPSTWGTAPISTATKNWVSQTGTDFDPGMPFGTYTICIRDAASSTRRYWTTTYNNTSPNGQATTVQMPPSSSGWTTTDCRAS